MKKVFLFLVASMMLTAPVMALAAPAGLNYLNGDANIVVHFDSKRLQQSQTFKDLMSMAMAKAAAPVTVMIWTPTNMILILMKMVLVPRTMLENFSIAGLPLWMKQP